MLLIEEMSPFIPVTSTTRLKPKITSYKKPNQRVLMNQYLKTNSKFIPSHGDVLQILLASENFREHFHNRLEII